MCINIDLKTNKVTVDVPVNSFMFNNNFTLDSINAIIKKRFNEYYMQSDIYPNINYKGTILNVNEITLQHNGNYTAHTKGILTIHGVSREVVTDVILTIKNNNVTVTSQITIIPTLYGIRIPSYIGEMYFHKVRIIVNGSLKPLSQSQYR